MSLIVQPTRVGIVTVLLAIMSGVVFADEAPRVDYRRHLTGAPAFNDYLTIDPAGRRLYISHVDRVTVVDLDQNL